MSKTKKKQVWITFYDAVDEIIDTVADLKKMYPEMRNLNLREIREGLLENVEEMGRHMYQKEGLRENVAKAFKDHIDELRRGSSYR